MSLPEFAPERRLLTSDNVDIAVYDLRPGAEHVDVALAHATGFCGPCWHPVVEALPSSVGRAVAWDFRGHGRSGRPHFPISWWDMVRDVKAVLDNHPDRPPIGVGHSMGGAALVMTELTWPGTFSGLVLVEPVLMPSPFRRAEHPYAALARKRRRRFASKRDARDSYATKPPFSTWDLAALDAYVGGGIFDDEHGAHLACEPETEAEVFVATGAHGVASMLGDLSLPVEVIVGASEDIYDLDWCRDFAGSIPGAELIIESNGNHFLPMERPGLIAARIVAMSKRVMATRSGA